MSIILSILIVPVFFAGVYLGISLRNRNTKVGTPSTASNSAMDAITDYTKEYSRIAIHSNTTTISRLSVDLAKKYNDIFIRLLHQ